MTEECGLGASGGEGDFDAMCGLFDPVDPGADLQHPQADGIKLSGRQLVGLGGFDP